MPKGVLITLLLPLLPLPVILQADPVFEGLEGPNTLVKYNPLSNVTSAEVGVGAGWCGLHVSAVVVQGLRLRPARWCS